MFFLIHNLLLYTVKFSYRPKTRKNENSRASLEPLRPRPPAGQGGLGSSRIISVLGWGAGGESGLAFPCPPSS